MSGASLYGRRRLAVIVAMVLIRGYGNGAESRLLVRFSSAYRGGRVTLQAHLENLGVYPLQALRLEAELDGVEGPSTARYLLEPGAIWQPAITMGAPTGPAGEYVARVRIHYADRTGRAVSALRAVPVLTAARPSPDGGLSIALGTFDPETGRIVATVHNRSDRLRSAAIQLHAPLPLAVSPAAVLLSIPAYTERSVVFEVAGDRSHLASKHAFLAVLDATVEGAHLSRHAVADLPLATDPGPPQGRNAATAAAALLMAFSLVRRVARNPRRVHRAHAFVVLAVLTVATVMIFRIIPPNLLVTDTAVTGGDTPAHNYLVRHLARQLAREGRLIGWAPDWWCGFPLFQFYFPLPYLVAVLLGTIVPPNIAFKLVTISGLVALPIAAWAGARRARLDPPAPALLAVAATLFLYDPSHTMWGGNVASTLAGMIANSISFPIMLLTVCSACRDADDGQFRLRTAGLLGVLFISHFFTTVMALGVIATLPLGARPGRRRRVFGLVLQQSLLGAAWAAWWLIPLIAKRELAVDFGTNWDIRLVEHFPAHWRIALPFAVVGAIWGVIRRRTFIVALVVMLVGSLILFQYGFVIDPVFVNIRLWPFMVFSLLGLAAVGSGVLLARAPFAPAATAAVALLALTWGIAHTAPLRIWATWNYAGMERAPNWPVFERLVFPLDGTPGRLANDLHASNMSMGSSRIFEAVPFRIDKPILEGGLVNSAAGSLAAYYIQSLTSQSHAGAPPSVRPGTFDLERATALLRVCNVKHFMARSQRTRDAMRADPRWKSLDEVRGWEVFELTTHDGSTVRVLPDDPIPILATNRQAAVLEWLYAYTDGGRFGVLIPPGEPPDDRFPHVLDMASIRELASARGPFRPEGEPAREMAESASIRGESVTANRISFQTAAIGKPHLVAVNWFPNWRVRGADRIYCATPGFMLVYPDSEQVEIRYGATASDRFGQAVTAIACLFAAAWIGLRAVPKHGAKNTVGKGPPLCQSDN